MRVFELQYWPSIWIRLSYDVREGTPKSMEWPIVFVSFVRTFLPWRRVSRPTSCSSVLLGVDPIISSWKFSTWMPISRHPVSKFLPPLEKSQKISPSTFQETPAFNRWVSRAFSLKEPVHLAAFLINNFYF